MPHQVEPSPPDGAGEPAPNQQTGSDAGGSAPLPPAGLPRPGPDKGGHPLGTLKLPSRGQARRARVVAIFLDRVVWNCRVVGREHVPAGPAILAGNHTGLMDGPVVIGAAPRGVHFMIKQELTKGVLGVIMAAAGQVPVDRSGGHQALRVCLALLAKGQMVGIFPEGTRGDGRMSQIHAGVGWLAVHSGAPVVPFACLGTRRQGESVGKIPPFRRRLVVEFGPALQLAPPPGLSEKAQISAVLPVIAQGLAAHVTAAVARTGLPLPTDAGRRGQR